MHRRSVEFFGLYLKDVHEAARRSPTLDGYHYWLMTDLPGGVEGDPSSLGLLNPFYEPSKFPDPTPFLRFNRETVLLMNADPDAPLVNQVELDGVTRPSPNRNAQHRVIGADEKKPVSLGISHFGAGPIRGGSLTWEVRDGTRVVDHGVLNGLDVEVGQVLELGRLTVRAGQAERPAKLVLSARLESQACRQENQWEFWAFPARQEGFPDGVADLTGVPAVGARYGAAATLEPGRTRVAVTDKIDAALLEYVAGGGAAVVLTEAGALRRPVPIPFWPQTLRSVGTVVEDGPAVAGFPSDGYCGYQFLRLYGDGGSVDALDLTTPGAPERERFVPAVWGLRTGDDPASNLAWNDPKFRVKLFRCGLVAEARMGSGRLIVCSLRVLEGVRRDLPEAGYLLDCLVDHAAANVPAAGGQLPEPDAVATPPLTPDEARTVFEVR